ncbi:MAG: reverse transcriptase domain-containing protein [Gammaproteobacteria bacterium]
MVYESAADEHIKELRKTLAAKAWQPSHATRIYLPKPSGLQRPLSLLDIEDQIVLQAIANQFATKLYKKRQRVELETVFSNKLASPRDSIFFMERWQTTYSAFQDKCTEAFNNGLRWSAHFDLSAYYDTISHDLLLSIVSPSGDEPETINIVKDWLRIWSADNISTMTGHGIPQGPIASDFLAEAYFLPIDLQLQKASFQYIRYVDDIRLFGRTENEVREAAIRLEQECRHRGLIPQSAKFDIRKLNTADEALGSLPSISPADGKGSFEKSLSAAEARKILASAIGGRPQRIKDKARFRYIMYRAPEDTKILNDVLRLLPRHPEHIDAFVAYFANYPNKTRIAKAALDYLETGVPYSYVRGKLWHLIARLAGIDEMRRGLPMARIDARNRSRCVALSWGVMHFLMKCEDNRLIRDRRRLAMEHPLSRSLLAPILKDKEFAPAGHAVTLLKGTLMEQLAGARELQKRGIILSSLGLRQRNLPASCNRTLKSLGVIRRQHSASRDWISEILVSLYGCNSGPIWRDLLGSEYEHAMQFLIEAKARFPGAYSEWLGLQDSFSDIVIRQFFVFLRQKGMGGHSKTQDRNGGLVKYGSLIAKNTPFDTAYPHVASNLRDIH